MFSLSFSNCPSPGNYVPTIATPKELISGHQHNKILKRPTNYRKNLTILYLGTYINLKSTDFSLEMNVEES